MMKAKEYNLTVGEKKNIKVCLSKLYRASVKECTITKIPNQPERGMK